MSILETVTKVREAEAQAERILAEARAAADEDLRSARRAALARGAAVKEEARAEIEALGERMRTEEIREALAIEQSAWEELAALQGRAARNRTASAALLWLQVEGLSA